MCRYYTDTNDSKHGGFIRLCYKTGAPGATTEPTPGNVATLPGECRFRVARRIEEKAAQIVTFSDFAGGGGSRNVGHNPGRMAEIHQGGEFAGMIRDLDGESRFHVTIGSYPNEKIVGNFRTERAAQRAARKALTKRD